MKEEQTMGSNNGGDMSHSSRSLAIASLTTSLSKMLCKYERGEVILRRRFDEWKIVRVG